MRRDGQTAREHLGLEVRHQGRSPGDAEYVARLATQWAAACAQHAARVASHVAHQRLGAAFLARATHVVVAQRLYPRALDVSWTEVSAKQHIRECT